MTHEELELIIGTPAYSTCRQRRALYRLGYSKTWVNRYGHNVDAAAVAINHAVQVMGTAKSIETPPPPAAARPSPVAQDAPQDSLQPR